MLDKLKFNPDPQGLPVSFPSDRPVSLHMPKMCKFGRLMATVNCPSCKWVFRRIGEVRVDMKS